MTPTTHAHEVTVRDWETPGRPAGDPLRVAVVGVGWFAREWALPAIEESTECVPAALVSGSPGSAADVAETFGVDRTLAYEEFHDGDAADAYDAAFVGTPNARHLPAVETAADLGKHVLCEKPLEASLDRARRAADAMADADGTLMVGYRLQVDPTIRHARELIRSGAVGDPVQVHTGFTFPTVEMSGPDSWRFDPDLAGGGATIDLGVYSINTCRFLLDADPTAVQATAQSPGDAFAGVRDAGDAYGIDGHATFQLTFPGATTAACTASFDAHLDDLLHVVGTGGVLRVENPYGIGVGRELTVDDGDLRRTVGIADTNEVVEEFDYFAHHARAGTDPEPDGADAVRDMEVVDAVYESVRTGERVEIGG